MSARNRLPSQHLPPEFLDPPSDPEQLSDEEVPEELLEEEVAEEDEEGVIGKPFKVSFSVNMLFQASSSI
jgi:hypothetical protein